METEAEPWIFVEPYCGLGAISLALLGWKRGLCPYQGGKWSYRKPILALLREHGFTGSPNSLVISDITPSAIALSQVVSPWNRCKVIPILRAMDLGDPKSVYDSLHGSMVPESFLERASQYLFLQRLSFSGKAVTVKDGRWSSPGFNKTSAYGVPATPKFGAINPMVGSLIRNLERAPESSADVLMFSQADDISIDDSDRTAVYIDPPYEGVTGYGSSIGDPVMLARKHADAGHFVIYSEAKCMKDRLGHGWESKQIKSSQMGKNNSPFKSKKEEWITWTGEEIVGTSK